MTSGVAVGVSLNGAARSLPARDLVDRVRARLVDAGQEPTAASVAAAVREEGRILGTAELLAVLDAVSSELSGFGVLEEVIADPAVTDVLVNGCESAYVDRGFGLEPVRLRLPDEQSVRRLAVRLASAAGRRLDDAAPWVDGRLRDGVRLHAVLPPVATGGTCISLRIPRRRTFRLAELEAAGTLTNEMTPVLRGVIRSRLAFLITGGTGTGKTTLLSALLSEVADRDRMVLVEDTGELRPEHQHVVRLEARPPNVEGAGEITLRDLVRQALRMRPDRLVVGEVRGLEVVDLLGALNTGHEGGCGTIHANTADAVPARVEALASPAGRSRAAIHSQLATAVDLIIGLSRRRDGSRIVADLGLCERGADGVVEVVPALTRDGPGPGYRRLLRLMDRRGAAHVG